MPPAISAMLIACKRLNWVGLGRLVSKRAPPHSALRRMVAAEAQCGTGLVGSYPIRRECSLFDYRCRADWYDFARPRRRRIAEFSPGLGERPALFEQITAPVGRLHLVGDGVCERHFADLARECRPLGAPIGEARPEAVHGQIATAHPAHFSSRIKI